MISLVLSERLHPIALERFADTSETSIRRILDETASNPTAMSDWRKTRQLALLSLSADGFTEPQIAVFSKMLDSVIEMITDFIVQLAGRLKVIPMTELSGIARILALMMKEEGYADSIRNN